jgi:hypothetical protein
MLSKFSKAGSGITLFLISIFSIIGFDIPDLLVENAVQGVMAILGLALAVWGQLDRTDLKWGLFRK